MSGGDLLTRVLGAVPEGAMTASDAQKVIRMVFTEIVNHLQATGEVALPGVGRVSLQKKRVVRPEGAQGHAAPLEYHRVLLSDNHRMSAYKRALEALIQPGDVVLDLGTGSGILAMMAARCGASRVYGVEITAVAGVAREMVRRNGWSDVVRVVQDDAQTMQPLASVNLIVSDCMGSFVVDDGMLPVARAAAQWLKPTGRFCPRHIALRMAPVGDISLPQIDLFEHPLDELDLSAGREYALNYCYVGHLEPSAVMAEPATLVAFDLPDYPPQLDHLLSFEVSRGGRLQALAGWFDAELCPEVILSTEPGTRSHWGQYLFPLEPMEVQVGDRLEVRLRRESLERDVPWMWSGAIHRGLEVMGSFDLESWQRLGSR